MQISEISCMILDATLSYNAIREMQDTRKFLTNASEELELLGTRRHSDAYLFAAPRDCFSIRQTREYSIGIILTGARSSGRNKALKKRIIQIKKPYELQTTCGSRFCAAFDPELTTLNHPRPGYGVYLSGIGDGFRHELHRHRPV